MKKVLFISEWYPWPLNLGGHIRRYFLVEHLARLTDLTLVTFRPEPDSDELEAYGPSPLKDLCSSVIEYDSRKLISKERTAEFSPFAPIRKRITNLFTWPLSNEAGPWMAPEVIQSLKNVIDDVRPDAVWVDRSYIGEAALAAGAKNVTVDIDDLLSTFHRRELKYSRWYKSKFIHYLNLIKLSRYEKSLPKKFSRVVVCKKEDKQFFRGHPDNVFVVPNGTMVVDKCEDSASIDGQLLFVGAFNYEPNQDAVRWFIQSMLPQIAAKHPSVKFVAVGRTPEPDILALRSSHVEIVPNAPTLRTHYESASVVVCPLRRGGGTKLKVLEALVHGKALVATPHSVEGLDLRVGIDYEVAHTESEFVEVCSRLLKDSSQRISLGQSGRERVISKYDWNAVAPLSVEALGLQSTNMRDRLQDGNEVASAFVESL